MRDKSITLAIKGLEQNRSESFNQLISGIRKLAGVDHEFETLA